MKQHLIIIIIVLSVLCLLVASIASINRARSLPDRPESESESTSGEQTEQIPEDLAGIVFTEYTKEAHPGTGIAYRGNGANASKIIVIDAGHQKHAMSQTEPNGPGSETEKAKVTGGTQGTLTGLAEYELNLRVALALRDALVQKGYTVVMVRETNEVEISNAERAQLANKVGAHVFVRIHANGDPDASMKGAMTVCQTSENPYNAEIYEQCRRLSEVLLEAFCQGTDLPQRSVWETDTMTGTNWASVPTTILEMGFMTNAEDEAAMAAEGFAIKAAEAIAGGIEAYLTEEHSSQTEPQTTEPEQTTPDTTEPQTTKPAPEYEIDYERENELGESFVDVYMTMEATGAVWVRSEPSTQGGDSTKVYGISMYAGKRVICIGLGEKWNRVLIDGKVYYISAAYLKEVAE